MVNTKKIFLSTLLILLLSSLVSANWVTYSRDSGNSNYQPFGDGYYSYNSTDVSLNKTTDVNYITEIRPLALDFDGDGLEEIFVYDNSEGKIYVLNMNIDNDLIVKDSYIFPQITEGVITANEEGDFIYVAKSNSQITALTYNDGSISEYKTISDVNTMSSKLLCALQGATSVPICYYFDSLNYLKAWDINNNSITTSNITITHSQKYLLLDLDLDTIKDIYTYTGRTLKKIEGLDVSNVSQSVTVSPTSNDYIGDIASASGTSFAVIYEQPTTGRDDYIRIYDSNLNSLANTQLCSYASVPGSHPISLGVVKYNDVRHYYANCQGSQGTQGQIVDISGNLITNIGYVDMSTRATGNLLNEYNDNSEFIVGNTLYYINSTSGTKTGLSLEHTLGDNYIISDFNNNGFNDIIETTLSGLHVYTSVNIIPPSGNTIVFVSGLEYSGFYNFFGSSSVCPDSTLTFKSNRCLSSSSSTECSYYYDGASRQRIVANVGGTYYYGDWTYSVGDFTLSLHVTFNTQGTQSVILYIQLEDKPEEFSFNTGQFTINVNGNTDGINCNVPTDLLVQPTEKVPSGSTNEGIDDFFNSLLGNAPKTKALFGIGLILGIVMYVAYETKNWVILLITFVLATVLATIMGLLPVWVIVLFILVAILIMLFKGTLSKGNNEEL